MNKQECYEYLISLHKKYNKFSPLRRLAESVKNDKILITNALDFAKRYERVLDDLNYKT